VRNSEHRVDGAQAFARIHEMRYFRIALLVHDQALLDRPGNAEIQMDLFYDYRTNPPLYPHVQAYFRKHRPPTLIVWGKNDKISSRPTALTPTSATCPTSSFT